MRSLEIVPTSPELWPAITSLFSAGGDAKWCWCQYWRKPGANWSNTTPFENRADLEVLVAAEPAPGLVALEDGVAIGWVGLGPREDFPRHARSRTIPQLPGDGVWVVNCFVVARASSREGRRECPARVRRRLCGCPRGKPGRGVPGAHGRREDDLSVRLHGHGRYVRASRVLRSVANLVEGRHGSATRGHAPRRQTLTHRSGTRTVRHSDGPALRPRTPPRTGSRPP